MDPQRVARAAEAIRDGAVHVRRPAGAGEYRVRSFTRPDVVYRVDLERRECSCPDAAYRGRTCKHVLVVALMRGLEGTA